MRVKCRLRALRGERSLRSMEAETGISRGYLSRYENGKEFPRDHHVAALERCYGAPARSWFAPHVWIELLGDTGHALPRGPA